jgi:hypothetical protein
MRQFCRHSEGSNPALSQPVRVYLTWSAFGLFAGCEPEAFAVHLQDMDMNE